MKIRTDVLATKDIDWFCMISGIPVHGASAGGTIWPDLLNDWDKLIASQSFVAALPDITNRIMINTPCILRKLQEEERIWNEYPFVDFELVQEDTEIEEPTMEERIQTYAESFVTFARKGFFSFDRSDISNPESTLYDLIAFPIFGEFPNFDFRLPSITSNHSELLLLKTPDWEEQGLTRFEGVDMMRVIR